MLYYAWQGACFSVWKGKICLNWSEYEWQKYEKGDKSMNDKRSNLSEFVPGEEAVSIKIKLSERKLDLQ